MLYIYIISPKIFCACSMIFTIACFLGELVVNRKEANGKTWEKNTTDIQQHDILLNEKQIGGTLSNNYV